MIMAYFPEISPMGHSVRKARFRPDLSQRTRAWHNIPLHRYGPARVCRAGLQGESMSALMLQDRDELTTQVDAWLTAAGRGDQRAFDSLYQATSSMLLGVCMRVLGDRSEAEDVLQEVYVTVWRKAEQFDSARARASTWLGTIARNRCIDRLRSQPASALRAPIEVLDFAEDPSPTPAAHAESGMERAQLDNCIEQLEPKRQVLIRTAFFEGATYEELSARSGSPLGSVKSWIRRGLLQLRACLEA